MIAEPLLHDGLPITDSRHRNGDGHDHLLLGVWKEACRHIEIGESTLTIAAIRRNIPLEQVLVRRFDLERSCPRTVAVGVTASDHLVPNARTICSPAEVEGLLRWSRQGQVSRRNRSGGTGGRQGGARGSPRRRFRRTAERPGRTERGLVFMAAAGAEFDPPHLALVDSLLEPFSTALENDRRVREMAAMRAAAEADKSSLLTRRAAKTSPIRSWAPTPGCVASWNGWNWSPVRRAGSRSGRDRDRQGTGRG